MKRLATLLTVPALLLCVAADTSAQAGRRGTATTAETLPAVKTPEPSQQDDPQTTQPEDGPTTLCVEKTRAAERDALLAQARDEKIVSPREVDTRAVIKSKPNPRYTEEARRSGTSGTVRVRAVLSGTGRVTLVTVLRGLPDGLTQMAVDAACELKFQPAVKDGQPVAQRVILEYNFRIHDRGGAPIFIPSGPRRPR